MDKGREALGCKLPKLNTKNEKCNAFKITGK